MDDKIVKVIFKEGWETMYNNDLTQGDFGQVLQIEGITLPDENVEVHFSLTEHNGEAPISIGTVKDNVITVNIPDFILAKENTYNSSYEAYAWIYVTDGESGRTIRKIVFTIATRAKSTTNVPEDQKDQFLQEVRQVLTETKEVAQSVRDDADNGKFNGPQGPAGKDGKSAYEYAVEGGYTRTEEEFTESLAKTGQYITKSEHEEQLLKAMVKVTTDKAPFHHITDSANMKVVDFGMRGITEQETVPGNQLFDLASSNGFVSLYTGLSTEIDLENNILTTTNSHTSNRTGNLDLGVLDAGTYCISYTNINGYTTLPAISTGELKTGLTRVISIINDGSEFTLEKSTHCWLVWVVETANPLKLSNIMLNKDSTVLPFEEYVGGMPSPNPEHEEEIELAGVYNEETGRYEHKCVVWDKNLWNAYSTDYVQSIYIGWKVKDDETKPMCVTLIDKDTSIDISGIYFGISYRGYDSYQNVYWLVQDGNINTMSYSTYSSYISIYSGDIDDIIEKLLKRFDILVEDGNTYTGYTPHASQPFTLTSDRPLTKWDSLVKVDGVWYWDYKQLKLVVDGNLDWYMYDAFKGFILICLPEAMTRQDGYCNQLRNDIKGNSLSYVHNHMWLGVNTPVLYVLNVDYYDETLEDKGLASWKAHLNENPLEIYTYSDTSELVPLLDEEQELLHNLEMYYGVTNVYNEQGCPMWLTYAADQELHWNQKLLEIQQAII